VEGILVNQHLGEADSLQIWAPSNGGFQFIEARRTPERGSGIQRWLKLSETLADCRALLISGIGETPRQVLEENHILPVEMSGFIEMGLEAVYGNGDLERLKGRRQAQGCANGGCSGEGDGCG
jgi:nitrogen fixation protein NifB